jgi:hypothetical protein
MLILTARVNQAGAMSAQQQHGIAPLLWVPPSLDDAVPIYMCLPVHVSTTAGGIVVAVVIAAVVAVTVLETKAPGPETLQSVSSQRSHASRPKFWQQFIQMPLSCHCIMPTAAAGRGRHDA